MDVRNVLNAIFFIVLSGKKNPSSHTYYDVKGGL